MFKRIGELLVHYGELSNEELAMILTEQRRVYRPFGRIASEMFSIHETAIWRAWSEQYLEYAPEVDLDQQHRDSAVENEITPEDAHKYHLLPLRCHDGDLIMVTSRQYLPIALHYVDTLHASAILVWIASDAEQLERTLDEVYPISTIKTASSQPSSTNTPYPQAG